ncbi:hypothetical protein [Armatimonas rosea]|uniref:Uncharacterized protein n=1 Tax=Armatimonas rosea TaxID=685828 RepID=A0A7W9SN75_ARMRO|nr:hypothetical protein [Armatimonas rosea]MBB6049435.1 hypothetical protein [Armatimonas rosea]
MSQSEQQLTPEEREVLPGFAAPTPRRVRRKAHWRHDPWSWLECYRPFLAVIVIVAGALGALSDFFPVFRGSVTVLLIVFFVLGGGLAILLLPQSFNEHFGHALLVQSGQVAVGTVMSIEKRMGMVRWENQWIL